MHLESVSDERSCSIFPRIIIRRKVAKAKRPRSHATVQKHENIQKSQRKNGPVGGSAGSVGDGAGSAGVSTIGPNKVKHSQGGQGSASVSTVDPKKDEGGSNADDRIEGMELDSSSPRNMYLRWRDSTALMPAFGSCRDNRSNLQWQHQPDIEKFKPLNIHLMQVPFAETLATPKHSAVLQPGSEPTLQFYGTLRCFPLTHTAG